MNDPNLNFTILIIILCIAWYIGYLYYRKKEKFDPFKVCISPKWSLILKDYGGYDETGLEQLYEKHRKHRKRRNDNFHILKADLIFTVLKSSEDSNLIYNVSHKTFHSEADFREVIDEVEFGYSPYFYVMHDVKGYKLGITTHESGKKANYFGDSQAHIEIATIPYALFHMPALRYGTIKPDKLEGKLKEYGWTRVESDDPENNPAELNHKYFTVYYEHI
jgi:hypothetical protein